VVYRTAIGVDINPSLSREEVTYSIAYLNEERIIFSSERVNFKELLRYVRKFKPDILATDNIFELAKDENELRKLAFLLPDETNIVQVTGNPSNPTDTLVSIARGKGIEVGSKLSPLETAILAAKLALQGIGYKIKLRENETFILVTKATEPAAGGMSMNRYKRRIYGSIYQAISEIKSELTKNNLAYDFFPSKHSDGGVFIVQAQREMVRKYVKPYEGYGIRIRILPVVRNRIISKEEMRNYNRLLIVGYDPGLTVGIAILDIKGNLLFLESMKYAGLDEIREKIARLGKPVIIATDKSVVPAMINRLASDFGAEIWKPQRDLQTEEKKNIAKDYLYGNEKVDIKIDTHKRDALAAAILAFRKYKSLYEEIEKELKNQKIEEISPQLIFERVIKTRRNIKEIIEEELEKRENKEPAIIETKSQYNKEEIEKIKKKLEEMVRLFRVLQDIIQEKEEVIAKLNKKIERLKDEERIRIKTNEMINILNQKIENLEEENTKLKKKLEDNSQFLSIVIKALEEIAKGRAILLEIEEVEKIQEQKEKDVRYFNSIPNLDVKILNAFIKNRTKAIIFKEKFDETSKKYLETHDIAIIKLDELPHIEIDKFVVIDKEELRKTIESKISEIRNKNRDEKEKIMKIFEDYRRLKI